MCPSHTESVQKSSAMEAGRSGENDVLGSPISKPELSNHELPTSMLAPAISDDIPELSLKDPTTESPPVQMMDRSGGSSYRIPSSVFARTTSTSPMEWSVASNESLFSIHVGNTSFSKDNILWQSGELGLSGEAFPSGQFFSFSPNHPPSGEAVTDGSKHNDCLGEAEPAVETMKEVLKENAENQRHTSFSLTSSNSRHSIESGASIKSFAFPILAGDMENGVSAKSSNSVKVFPEDTQPQPDLQRQPEPLPQPSSQPEPTEPKTIAATPDKTHTKWFSCFSCCPF